MPQTGKYLSSALSLVKNVSYIFTKIFKVVSTCVTLHDFV